MLMDLLRARVAHNLASYPALFRGTRAVFRLLSGIRSEESYLEEVANRHRDVFFLQVGANDGLMEDHLHPFVRRFGWRGVLLEPIPTHYDRLVANYAGSSGLIFENRALANRNGPRSLFYLSNKDGRLPEWCQGVGSLDRDTVLRLRAEIPDVEDYLVEETVECLTFETLIAQHGIERIDVVVSDTEGYDLEILRQFDFERFYPELVVYEQVILSEEDKRAALHLLESYGYAVHRIGPNNAAVKSPNARGRMPRHNHADDHNSRNSSP